MLGWEFDFHEVDEAWRTIWHNHLKMGNMGHGVGARLVQGPSSLACVAGSLIRRICCKVKNWEWMIAIMSSNISQLILAFKFMYCFS